MGSLTAGATAFFALTSVDASGGATAGGAYLLRAKERYNARVQVLPDSRFLCLRGPLMERPQAGAKSYRGEAAALVEKGDFNGLAAYFKKDGAFDELANPAFLLANAFRINSTQNPDKIVQVQKFKAFKADADAVAAAAKKKKQPAVQEAYDKSLTTLAAYLDSVGLD